MPARPASTPPRRTAFRVAWMLLIAAVAIAASGAVIDARGFGFGYWGVELLAQAALAASLVGLATPGLRLPRLAHAAGLGTLGLLLLAVFPPSWLLWLLNSPNPPYYAPTSRRTQVAITIDDSLSPKSTPEILAVLANHDVHATFFVLSESIGGNEPLMAAMVAAGHEVANHQTRDVRGWRMSDAEFAADIREAGERLRQFAAVRWLRPGGGIYSRRMVATAQQEGYRMALGSVFPLDSHIASTSFIVNYVEARAHAGAIIVLHDGPHRGLRTAAALDTVLPRLKREGYQFVTLTELLPADRPARQDR